MIKIPPVFENVTPKNRFASGKNMRNVNLSVKQRKSAKIACQQSRITNTQDIRQEIVKSQAITKRLIYLQKSIFHKYFEIHLYNSISKYICNSKSDSLISIS